MVNCDRLCLKYCLRPACNPTLTRWQQHRYRQSRLCVTVQQPRQPQAYVYSLLWSLLITPWNKKVTTRSTVDYARYTHIIHCRPCCNLLIIQITCVLSTLEAFRSHMGLGSMPHSRSRSPWRWNSSLIRWVHWRYKSSGLAGLLRSAQCSRFWSTCGRHISG